MQSKTATVEQYLKSLPEDRRAAIEAVRHVILKNLSKGYEEGMQYGMIGYFVPHSVYPPGYHCDPKQPLPFAGIASQKNHMSLHLNYIYWDAAEESRFREAWIADGRRLDMGKSCIRFKKLTDVPLEVVGQTIKRAPVKKFVAMYEAALADRPRPASKVSKKTGRKASVKKASSAAGRTSKTTKKRRASS